MTMELKVWVEGIQRIVCGVSDATTCQDVVYALAHATGKTGRFTLIERWRNSERLLAPNELPRKILLKWGEYSSDVQFILQRNSLDTKTESKSDTSKASISASTSASGSPRSAASNSSKGPSGLQSPQPNRDIKKSLTFSGAHATQQLQTREIFSVDSENSIRVDPQHTTMSHQPVSPPVLKSSQNGYSSPSSSHPLSPSISDKDKDNCAGDINDNTLSPYSTSKAVKDLTNLKLSSETDSLDSELVKGMLQDLIRDKGKVNLSSSDVEQVVIDGYYKDLVKLVNVQRDKLSSQQIDLTKCEAEISYLEGRWKEEDARLTYIKSEIDQLEKEVTQDPSNEIGKLEHEIDEAKRKETAMVNQLTELKEKFSYVQSQLTQLNSKSTSLDEQLANESAAQNKSLALQKEQEENAISREIDKLQEAVRQSAEQTDQTEESSNMLSKQIHDLEGQLNQKKDEIESLKEAMKDANLEALAMAPPEEHKVSPEGNSRLGSNRRIKGSPRQLETAVPTSQNPHGVWV